MKQTIITRVLHILILFAVASVTAVHAAENSQIETGATVVSYDKSADLLSVEANQASLKFVLDRIAQHSGMEVLFDDLADAPVSINIQSEPLEDALKKLLKGGNYMLRYSRNDQENLLLIGVVVLPVGEQDKRGARRTVEVSDEAYYRARSQLSQQQVQQMDMANERWQARISEMPPEIQQRLMDHVKSRLLKQMEDDRENAKREAQRKQWIAENRARWEKAREQRREQASQGQDSEQRAAFERSSDEARERMRVILQDQQ